MPSPRIDSDRQLRVLQAIARGYATNNERGMQHIRRLARKPLSPGRNTTDFTNGHNVFGANQINDRLLLTGQARQLQRKIKEEPDKIHTLLSVRQHFRTLMHTEFASKIRHWNERISGAAQRHATLSEKGNRSRHHLIDKVLGQLDVIQDSGKTDLKTYQKKANLTRQLAQQRIHEKKESRFQGLGPIGYRYQQEMNEFLNVEKFEQLVVKTLGLKAPGYKAKPKKLTPPAGRRPQAGSKPLILSSAERK